MEYNEEALSLVLDTGAMQLPSPPAMGDSKMQQQCTPSY
jgi:hypothetical protein